MSTKRKPVKPSNVIHCIACQLDIDLLAPDGKAAFKQHMREKHQISDFKGKRTLAMHMDGDNWFSYSWDWEIGGVKLVQNTVQARSAEDQAYWDAAGG